MKVKKIEFNIWVTRACELQGCCIWASWGLQRMRWLDSITNTMDMNLCKLQEILKDRGDWCAIVPESQRVGYDLMTKPQHSEFRFCLMLRQKICWGCGLKEITKEATYCYKVHLSSFKLIKQSIKQTRHDRLLPYT